MTADHVMLGSKSLDKISFREKYSRTSPSGTNSLTLIFVYSLAGIVS